MKIVKGNYGECRFCDNMDEKHGLPSLEEKSWDLCLADPPYGIKFVGKTNSHNKKFYGKGHEYKDNRFIGFNWFDLIYIKAIGAIITPGIGQLFKYINHKNPEYQIKGWYKPNVVNFQNFDPILLYGKIKNISKWGSPLWNINVGGKDIQKNLIHPCPKSITLWNQIITKLKPLSVLDPFLGSGTTAEVCESLGIPWLGFELMEEYVPDIEKRIARGIKKHGQQTLTPFMGVEL